MQRRYASKGLFAPLVWGLLVLMIIGLIGGVLDGCSSPTQIEEECLYRADLEAWVGPGCEDE